MKAQQIKVADLKNFSDCCDAVDAIEGCYHNYYGGLARWLSGKETELKIGAKNKVKLIWAKAATFESEE